MSRMHGAFRLTLLPNDLQRVEIMEFGKQPLPLLQRITTGTAETRCRLCFQDGAYTIDPCPKSELPTRSETRSEKLLLLSTRSNPRGDRPKNMV